MYQRKMDGPSFLVVACVTQTIFVLWILVCAHAYVCLRARWECKKLPCVEAETGSECAVCLEALETGRKAPCGHVYHEACLVRWAHQSTACPMCRRDFLSPPSPLPASRLAYTDPEPHLMLL